jgi:hypothetical protein
LKKRDADLLTAGTVAGITAWSHYANLNRGKLVEHEVIAYCKANPGKLIIEAITVIFKDQRIKEGIRMT